MTRELTVMIGRAIRCLWPTVDRRSTGCHQPRLAPPRACTSTSASRLARTCSKARTSGAAEAPWPSVVLTFARASAVRPDRHRHVDHVVTGNRGGDHDEAVLVHAHSGDGATVGRAEEPHDRRRVPSRRGSVPTRFPVQVVDSRP